uniref:NADH dehydrogenase subunit 3 n=1 Tax=Venerupis aspera TaxID=2784313 RepID=UPI001BEFCF69|nr:NADH dehydrogenase subunit 3 [Venerupis aspera]YP_010455421.1 NADH dehydrogenase subunit 3 [Ruditapes variegatus]QUA05876.1 NADH dehydrogenase subunit 3 [Venerupis aspera]UUA63026.1 NADH dehydrogenase subunit 3 [Ruditapes variegatus]
MWYFEKSESFLGLYYSLVGMVFLVLVIGAALTSLAAVVSQKWRFEGAKLTSFECGFDSMSSSRMPFSLRFFLLALLFLVFDLEMILLFPYILSVMSCCAKMSAAGKVWGFVFLLILVGGLMHELNEGTLDWNMN